MEENQTVEEVVETEETTEETEVGAEETAAPKRAKKLSKGIEGTVVVIKVLDGEAGELRFDAAELPENVQQHLIPFGLGHKLGDSAAGRTGKDAEEAIVKVWEGLKSGNFTVRAPAAPKVSLSDIKDKLANMSPEEQEQAKQLLANMGFNL